MLREALEGKGFKHKFDGHEKISQGGDFFLICVFYFMIFYINFNL